MTTTHGMVQIMQAAVDGKPIEYRIRKTCVKQLWYAATTPIWDWHTYDYRIAGGKETLGNPIHKLRELFNSLDTENQRDLWDFMAALRGPDDNTFPGDLKNCTTAIVRNYLLEADSYCGECLANINGKVEDNIPTNAILVQKYKANLHFKNHINAAERVIKKYNLKRQG